MAVGPHLKQALLLEEAVFASERRAAAVGSGASAVGHELVGEDLHGVFGLNGLDRLRGQIREDVGVAVEAVGPGPRAPGAAGEVDIDERIAGSVVSAVGDPGDATVGGSEHLVRQHHRERAESAVNHAKSGEPARRAGRGQHRVGNGSGRRRDGDGAEDALVIRNPRWQHRTDRGVSRCLRPGKGAVDCTLYLLGATTVQSACRLSPVLRSVTKSRIGLPRSMPSSSIQSSKLASPSGRSSIAALVRRSA